MATPPVLGIMGGGQLARMLVLAAHRLGAACCVLTDDPDAPALQVTRDGLVGDYTDPALLEQFAARCQAVTVEFENLPAASLAWLVGHVPRFVPDPSIFRITQDRLEEKRFLHECGIATADFAPVDADHKLEDAVQQVGLPAILKTRTLGYDGKGQWRIPDAARARALVRAQIPGTVPAILERHVPFFQELSVTLVADASGRIVCYDPACNEHRRGVLRRSRVPVPPAALPAAARNSLLEQSRTVARKLGLEGLLTIEWFDLGPRRQRLRFLANEMAARPHNSAHWTQDGAVCCQFEQLVRVALGHRAGQVTRIADVQRDNLLGSASLRWAARPPTGASRLHLYGKGKTTPLRKMGHRNLLWPLGKAPWHREKTPWQ